MPNNRDVYAIRVKDKIVFAVDVSSMSTNAATPVDKAIIELLRDQEMQAQSNGDVFTSILFDTSRSKSIFMQKFTKMIASFIAGDNP